VVKALPINIDTRDAVVSLSGAVHTEAQRVLAARLAQQTKGVKNVRNFLTLE
jgi:osmotically-inducible protein OsmY